MQLEGGLILMNKEEMYYTKYWCGEVRVYRPYQYPTLQGENGEDISKLDLSSMRAIKSIMHKDFGGINKVKEGQCVRSILNGRTYVVEENDLSTVPLLLLDIATGGTGWFDLMDASCLVHGSAPRCNSIE